MTNKTQKRQRNEGVAQASTLIKWRGREGNELLIDIRLRVLIVISAGLAALLLAS